VTTIRRARFAHQWYPGEPEALRRALAEYTRGAPPEERVRAVVAPHAGYVYSGPVAGAVYGRVRVPDTAVVLCVNHRGAGARASILTSGQWETPLGAVPLRPEVAAAILERAPFLEEDPAAHADEHSLEMQVPFLRYRNEGVHLVPISLQHLSLRECERLGEALAGAVVEHSGEVLMVASTDMTHFESQEAARRKDGMAIERIVAVDPKGLYETVRGHRISMCGVVPTTVVLFACRRLGVERGTLVRYATSGDVSGDYQSVVGYAAVMLA
jgi:AmmeMemoRadiSam system protein B